MTARTRATNSSGEKGTVRMSSTPRSKAASFALRSPRRVSAMTGRLARLLRGAEPVQDRAPGDVHVEDGEMGLPLRERHARFRRRLRHARAVLTVIERELDDLGEDGLVDHQQRAGRSTETLVARGHRPDSVMARSGAAAAGPDA